MSNSEISSREDPEALLGLLENIVASYQDNDSRPADALTLYRQRVQLGASYRVKLNKRFVVVDGGSNPKPESSCAAAHKSFDKRHLKLVAKAPTLTLLP